MTDDTESTTSDQLSTEESIDAEETPKRGRLVWALIVLASVIVVGTTLN
ncbi:MAG: hypothetical protein GXP35_18485, partial [Actinobacteria bacterium]|nr:hypothetical protein [Actinomycetota bacterium]